MLQIIGSASNDENWWWKNALNDTTSSSPFPITFLIDALLDGNRLLSRGRKPEASSPLSLIVTMRSNVNIRNAFLIVGSKMSNSMTWRVRRKSSWNQEIFINHM